MRRWVQDETGRQRILLDLHIIDVSYRWLATAAASNSTTSLVFLVDLARFAAPAGQRIRMNRRTDDRLGQGQADFHEHLISERIAKLPGHRLRANGLQ